MSGKGNRLEYSLSCAPDEVASYLEQMDRQLREGNMMLRSGDKSIELQFGSEITLDIGAKSKPSRGKGSLEIELSWKECSETEKEQEELEILSADTTSTEEIKSADSSTEQLAAL